MIFGVISFTFVVSNINSILSQTYRAERERSKNLIILESIKEKYDFSPELIEVVKMQINKPVPTISSDNFQPTIKIFPTGIKNELLYSMYKDSLNQITFFKDLPPEIINVLGQALTPIVYTAGKTHCVN